MSLYLSVYLCIFLRFIYLFKRESQRGMGGEAEGENLQVDSPLNMKPVLGSIPLPGRS